VSSFLNVRVADIYAAYAEWSARGAQLLSPPKQHQYEIRCYMRDPDGDWWPADWAPINPGGQSD
jgi:hypothetical protein